MISKEAAQQLRRRFERFAELRAEYGTQKALEMMRSNLSDVQKKLMEPYHTSAGCPSPRAFGARFRSSRSLA